MTQKPSNESRGRLGLTTLASVLLVILGVCLYGLLSQPIPNPFGVGVAGLLLGALVAALIAVWWPKR